MTSVINQGKTTDAANKVQCRENQEIKTPANPSLLVATRRYYGHYSRSLFKVTIQMLVEGAQSN